MSRQKIAAAASNPQHLDPGQVIFWPLTVEAGPDNSVWFFNSTVDLPTNTTSTPPGGSNATVTDTTRNSLAGPIAGGVIGGVIILAGLLALAFYLGRRVRSTPTPPSNPFGLTYQTTPFVGGEAPSIMPPAPPVMIQNPVMPAMSPPRRHGFGSVHKPSLDSRTSTSPDQPVPGMSGHERMLSSGSWAPGGAQTVASSSSPSLPFASTAGSRATESILLERDPPPVYR